MRLIATLFVLAVFGFCTAQAMASGAYATAAADSASDCVKLCSDDTLCVGSAYDAGACGLWASVPRDAPRQFTLSHSAPGFAREIQVASATAHRDSPPEQPNPSGHENAAVALLGGDGRSEDIRPRLGGN